MNELLQNRAKIAECRKRAADLVAQMTLSEKVGQMLNWAPAIERLGIPAYNWWNESLHGVGRAGIATVFPQAISMAAAFDEDMMETVGDAISTEARAKYNMQQKYGDRDIYKGLTFWAPNVNIFRDPRWGRGHETYGEDPYLTSRLGVRFVEGMQGHNPECMKVAACAKHFAVHSGPEDIRHSFNAEVSEQDLWETYLPAFRALVKEAGVEAVMGAYNRTNGEPCCGSKTLLKDILRDTWGFEGHVTSDCWAIKDFHEGHMVTEGPEESVALAINNGCETNCGNLFVYAEAAVKDGLVKEETIDAALVDLFTTRMKLGMFDEHTPFDGISYREVDSPEMRKLNREVAEKCIVLLKNQDNLLPLDKTQIKTLGIVGPNADNRRCLVGNYEGTASRYVTIQEGLQDYLGDDVRIMVSQGCPLWQDRFAKLSIEGSSDRFAEVRGVCEQSDVVIAVMGLDSGLEGEEGDQGNQFASGDKKSLKLPGHQQELLEILVESGKPVVLVVVSGSALDLTYAEDHIPAIVQAFYPGGQGGAAVARILFGDANPQGKLPITFYRSDEDLPSFTDYSMKERTYRYMTKEPLYPFGYGLSYTTFEAGPAVVTGSIDSGEVTVSLPLTNTGDREGAQTLQVYVKADRPGTPNPQLKRFVKVSLKPHEKTQIVVKMDKKCFATCDNTGTMVTESGTYHLYVGMSQPDVRSVGLLGEAPQVFTLTAEERTIFEK